MGHYDVVSLLCRNNADLTIKNYRGHTAFDQAVEKGHTEIINLLSQYKQEETNYRKQ